MNRFFKTETAAWVALAALPLVLLGVYAGAFHHPFHYDDIHSIVENPHIRLWRNLPAFFVRPELFSHDPHGAMYRPLVLVSYLLNYTISDYAVWSYHLVNLALHGTSALLLWMVLRAMGVGRGFAVASCYLFALHPLNAEVVNYISSRSESLCASAMLVSLGAYVRARGAAGRGLIWGAVSLVGLLLALLAKSVGVTVLGLLLLWEVVGRGLGVKKGVAMAVRRQWPYWLVTAVYLLMVRDLVGAAVVAHPVRTLTSQWLTQIKALVYYLSLVVTPVSLSVEPGFTLAHAGSDGAVVLAAALVVSVLVAGGRAFGRGGKGAFWLLAALVVLLPTLVIPLNVLVNEHRLYLSTAAFAAAAGLLLQRTAPCRRSRLTRALVVMLGIFALLAGQRTSVWASPARLWEDALSKAPMMPRPHIYVGDVHKRAGRYTQALKEYRIALESYPEVLTAAEEVVIHNNMGAAYLAMGDYLEAASAYQQALRLDSTYVLAVDGYDAATAMLRRANNPEARKLRKLGLSLMISGQLHAAVQRLRQSLQLQDDAQTWMALGMAYERQGDVAAAVRTYSLLARLHDGEPYAENAAKRVHELRGAP